MAVNVDPTRSSSAVHPLSPLDHLSPRIHLPKLLYFETDAPADVITATLRNALVRVLETLPVLAGSVGPLPAGADVQTGSLAVQAPYFDAASILSTQDLRDRHGYAEIAATGFAADAVAGEVVMPDLMANTTRVMMARANFIRGGLLLVCAVHHCVVDEAGIFRVIDLWSRFCADEAAVETAPAEWLDRTPVMRGVGAGRLEDHPEYKLRPEVETSTGKSGSAYVSETAKAAGTAIIFFSEEALGRLKAAASGSGDAADGSSWVSTNDALCALVWCRVTAARMADGAAAGPSMYNMTVDGRPRLEPPLSANYMGNVVFVSKALEPVESLGGAMPASLALAARSVRSSVRDVDAAMVRDVIQMVRAVPDIGRLSPTGFSSLGRNIGCSSWARQPYYALDWGAAVGGACRRVRWRNLRSDGLMIVFPRIPAGREADYGPGGLEILLGLQLEHMQWLREDKVFGEYAEWRSSSA